MPKVRIRSDGKARRPKKQQTTICPLLSKEDQKLATEMVREAIRKGEFKIVAGNEKFPDRIWHREKNGNCWEGRCINRTTGEYKGWPISEDVFENLQKRNQVITN